jgi:hypothetical protein
MSDVLKIDRRKTHWWLITGFAFLMLLAGFAFLFYALRSNVHYFDPQYKVVWYRVVRSGSFMACEHSPTEVWLRKELRGWGLPVATSQQIESVDAHGPIPSIYVVCGAYRQVRGELVDNFGRVSECDGGFAAMNFATKTVYSGSWSLNPHYRDHPEAVCRFRLKDWDTGVKLAEIKIGKILIPDHPTALNP